MQGAALRWNSRRPESIASYALYEDIYHVVNFRNSLDNRRRAIEDFAHIVPSPTLAQDLARHLTTFKTVQKRESLSCRGL
jgi:hypothetical protein